MTYGVNILDESLHDKLVDAVETVLLAHEHIPDVVCTCGARNNMDGDLLHSHRISLIDNAIEDVLNGEGM